MSPTYTPALAELPLDVLLVIGEFLNCQDAYYGGYTCRTLHSAWSLLPWRRVSLTGGNGARKWFEVRRDEMEVQFARLVERWGWCKQTRLMLVRHLRLSVVQEEYIECEFLKEILSGMAVDGMLETVVLDVDVEGSVVDVRGVIEAVGTAAKKRPSMRVYLNVHNCDGELVNASELGLMALARAERVSLHGVALDCIPSTRFVDISYDREMTCNGSIRVHTLRLHRCVLSTRTRLEVAALVLDRCTTSSCLYTHATYLELTDCNVTVSARYVREMRVTRSVVNLQSGCVDGSVLYIDELPLRVDLIESMSRFPRVVINADNLKRSLQGDELRGGVLNGGLFCERSPDTKLCHLRKSKPLDQLRQLRIGAHIDVLSHRALDFLANILTCAPNLHQLSVDVLSEACMRKVCSTGAFGHDDEIRQEMEDYCGSYVYVLHADIPKLKAFLAEYSKDRISRTELQEQNFKIHRGTGSPSKSYRVAGCAV